MNRAVVALLLTAAAVWAAPSKEASAPAGRASSVAPSGAGPVLVAEPGSPPASSREFPKTDFTRSTVAFGEILSGGPPRDGIPPVDNPRFVAVREARDWLADDEAVLVVSRGADSHLYPVQVLMWHEIVNDQVGDLPVAVTYCPLCNSGLAFVRRVDGQVVDFGTTGRLRFSNLIMYDRQSETWWQQAEGRGLIGLHVGRELEQVPMLMLSWKDASERHPDGRVLSRETGHNRPYGSNPYTGYDRSEFPFLFQGPPIDGDYSPMTRVVAVSRDGGWQAYPYPVLQERGVVNDSLGGSPIVVIWKGGTASALDGSSVSGGRDVGTANGFLARVDGRDLSFKITDGAVTDEQTGSSWDAGGTAVSGTLKGRRLEPLVSVQHFWFSWTAFRTPGPR